MVGCETEQVSVTVLLNPFCGLAETVPITEPPLLIGPSEAGAFSQNPGVVFSATPIVLDVSRPMPSASLSAFRSATTDPKRPPLTLPGLAENVPSPRPA